MIFFSDNTDNEIKKTITNRFPSKILNKLNISL